jgi:hypothetical protein
MAKKTKTSEVNQDVLDFKKILVEKKNYSGPYISKIVEDIIQMYDNHFNIESSKP